MARSTYSTVLNRKTPTPQSKPLVGRETEMVVNSAGGYTFTVTPFTQLERFLILGSDAPTYYTTAQKLTEQNAACVRKCIAEDGLKTVKTIVEVSDQGRAPKNDPALFALAMCATYGDLQTKSAAFDALPKVARIGTHLLHFADYMNGLRGWGRAAKRAVAEWFTSKTTDNLAYQVVKYQNRDGWAQRDLLRLAHPKTSDASMNDLFKYIVKQGEFQPSGIQIIEGFEKAKRATSKDEVVKLIADYGLTREMIPTQFLTEAVVWDALLQKMPLTAMIRNLGNMSKCGLLVDLSDAARLVVKKLKDETQLRKSRVHPVAVLLANKTYGQGHGLRGNGLWTPVQTVTSALEDAFYLAFGNVVPTGKRMLYALDVSGSMGSPVSGLPITCREMSGVLAMVSARVEDEYFVFGFSTTFVPLQITPKMTIDQIERRISGLPFSGTDCSLPMTYALKARLKADAFYVITDNETWAGSIHPIQALKRYRNETGINAKLIVQAMTATPFTIADPNDPGCLDVVGMDTAVPNIVSDFVRGSGVKLAEESVED